ncbi:MAG: sterol desaturase family protein [Bacteroidia bacterium]|nr:sterol desaturase family protein [Bacteroidia bacterium]
MLNTTAFLIPVFLLLVSVECYISFRNRDDHYHHANTAMNLCIGAMDQLVSLFSFGLLYFVMNYVFTHFRIIENNNIWYQWIGGYVAVDFLSYWYHRWSHRVNILWAGHITHHSSDLFNYSNGFRTSFFQGINRIFFWAFLPVFGFSPVILLLILKISGVFDFLQHTTYVPKLKWIEKIFVTPSAHRVHHGKNDIYIDKNYGSNFIVWDKLFGTYQEETEKVIYGITGPYTDENPYTAISHHYRYLWNTMRSAPRWTDRIKLLFMPPEWKPSFAPPVHVRKAMTPRECSLPLQRYAWLQLIAAVSGINLILAVHAYMPVQDLLLCSAIGISSLANASLLLKHRVPPEFERQEMARILAFLILSLTCIYLNQNAYLWVLVIYLTSLAVYLALTQPVSFRLKERNQYR